MKVSMGIMAYNEETNIGRLLNSIMEQELFCGKLTEIIVVASGCTDNTEAIVKENSKRDSRISLLTQPTRKGKASAINLFLSNAVGDIIILESADTLPEKDTLDRLVRPFLKADIGMTGAHPIPANSGDTFIGFAVHLMWGLHHKIALENPKLGELVAFRNFIREIPVDTAVDEAYLEALVIEAGYRLFYVPEAIVYNQGPQNIRDFLIQRRRIAVGHKSLKHQKEYDISTSNPYRILSILLKDHSWKLRETIWTLGTILLELVGRILGYYDYTIRKKKLHIWDIAVSTKKWN